MILRLLTRSPFGVALAGLLLGISGAVACGSSSSDASTPTVVPAEAGPPANGDGGLAHEADAAANPRDAAVDAPTVDAADLAPGSIATGVDHSCAILDDRSLKCWGSNNLGAIGRGDREIYGDGPNEMGPSLPAVDLGPGRTAVSVAAGSDHTCALLDDHSIKCWGDNTSGQLGQGNTVIRGRTPNDLGANLAPVDLGPGRTALDVSTNASSHVCALLDDHSIKCWGDNTHGGLGLGDTNARGDGPGEMGASLPAVDLGPGRTALAVSAGYAHTCAVLDDHSIRCWGWNTSGQLGLGDTASRGGSPGEMGASLPAVDLGPGRSARAVSTGNAFTCALLDNATVRCWGYGYNGQLGLGDTLTRGDGPGEMGAGLPAVDLGPGRTALAVSARDDSACALLDDRSLKCWGFNGSGGLGLGDMEGRGDGPNEMGANLLPIRLQ